MSRFETEKTYAQQQLNPNMAFGCMTKLFFGLFGDLVEAEVFLRSSRQKQDSSLATLQSL